MGKVRRQAEGYYVSVKTTSSGGAPVKPEKSSEFTRFKELAAKLVHTPKPSKS
jgi:hypothetical protein